MVAMKANLEHHENYGQEKLIKTAGKHLFHKEQRKLT